MAVSTLKPVYQERIWGGQNLKTLFNRQIPEDKCIGEAWELCDRQEAQCLVGDSGQSLHDLWASPDRQNIFGSKSPDTERFPILIKVLDAQDKLSLQVHPPANLAPRFNGEPKTEMWYFLETTEDADIFVGLKKGVSRQDFERAIQDKKVADCFHRIKTSPGETMFLPSGRVHAIGSGNVILEIQQNSDTTFRVYDWDRVDIKTGKSRDLHVAESLECINFEDYEPDFAQPHGDRIVACDYFSVFRNSFYEKESGDLEVSRESFQYLFISQGSFTINGILYPRGTSLFLPADTGRLEVQSMEGYAEMITVTWPI